MPLPRGLARFNRVVTNKITKPAASRLGGFTVLHHVGRKTGRLYETPLNAWKTDEGVVVALTYGDDVDWLKNARAAGMCTLTMGGQELRVGRPEPVGTDIGLSRVPRSIALILKMLGVDQFVLFPSQD